MNIVHVITRLILGGAQENTILTCEGLAARGHEVTLITGPALGPEGELLTRARSGDYKVIVVQSLRRAINPLLDAVAYRALLRRLGDLKADIVHTHSSKSGILARRAAAKLRANSALPKIVHTVHGLPFHPYGGRLANRLYIALERQAARQTDAIISVADAMTTQALTAAIGRTEQYTTIYSGMEIEVFTDRPDDADDFRRSLGLGEGDVLVTQVSRLAKLKGHEFILAAAEKIADRRVHFCFVGDGRRRGRIERAIRASAGLTGRVHLTGLLRPEKMPTVMHAADILVHCSLREGLARALPQAMLAGKPVISFDIDGAREVVDADTGVLLEAGDIAGLKAAIETLAASAELRARLGAAGRRLAAGKFDHRIMVEKIESLYERIMEE
ncbi:MAG: glycosyltransferase family 4 protein [Planctomycetota bacterium]|nr:glycosyltransferase family 4 protein [Planctomycetota bacterium]